MSGYFSRSTILKSAAVFILAFVASAASSSADTCTECHTSLDKLKKLAPAQVETGPKLSEGEG